MSLSRVFGNSSRTAVARCRNLAFLSPPPPQLHHHQKLSVLSHRFHSLSDFSHKSYFFQNGVRSATAFKYCGMSTSAPDEHEQENKGDAAAESDDAASAKTSEQTKETGSNSDSQPTSQTDKKRRRGTKRTAFSDSDSEVDLDDLSREEVVKVLLEKEEVLQKKEKEFADWKDKILRGYAEMENVMERTRREAENSKKFAVQNFAKSLLDVADNLSRASTVTKESFGKIDVSGDTIGAVPVLKTLLEGVEMTEKQLAERSDLQQMKKEKESRSKFRHATIKNWRLKLLRICGGGVWIARGQFLWHLRLFLVICRNNLISSWMEDAVVVVSMIILVEW